MSLRPMSPPPAPTQGATDLDTTAELPILDPAAEAVPADVPQARSDAWVMPPDERTALLQMSPLPEDGARSEAAVQLLAAQLRDTQAQLVQAYDFANKYLDVQGQINTILNAIDSQRKTLASAHASLAKSGNSALLAKVDAAQKSQDAIFRRFTANYQNDEDSLQFPGQLREDVPRSGFGDAQPPTPALLAYAQRFDAAFAQTMREYQTYLRTVYDPLVPQFKSAGAR